MGWTAERSWEIALAQHPMYLLISEDETCAERTPPWGEPTPELYADRLRENLDVLRREDRLRLGYEWSGLELEMLNENAPDVLDGLRELAASGRVSFYNGTFAQPHMQILSHESNAKQLELGAAVYRSLGLPAPVTFLHQESSLHEQMPQLLRAFGLRHAVLPGFTTRFELIDGPAELTYVESGGFRVLEGDDFLDWQGLDGTRIPFYLGLHDRQDPAWRRREATLGLLRVPPIVIDMPDLTSIDDGWLGARGAERFVLLDEALDARLQAAPPRARARIWSGWSYLEGIEAEELCRTDRAVGDLLLRTEAALALAHALAGERVTPLEDAWRVLLRCQHHDVHCFCGPQLRRGALERLGALDESLRKRERAATHALASHVSRDGQEGDPVLVLNASPHHVRTIVEVERAETSVVDPGGRPVPCAANAGGTGTRFLAELDGLGYRVYHLRGAGADAAPPQQLSGASVFSNDSYRLVIEPDGVISSLVLLADGGELIDGARGGNVLTATDSHALGVKQPHSPGWIDHDNSRWADSDDPSAREAPERLHWEPPVRGPERAFVALAPAELVSSPLGARFRVCGSLGEDVRASLELECYHELPRIDVTWTFAFENASVGTYFDDDSKLVSRWGLGFDGEVSHDIPFGVVAARAGRPFLATSWVDWSDGERGLAHLHLGTPKHWVEGRALSMLMAWGEDTDAFGNRDGLHRWFKPFDYRLRGIHTIRSAIVPHAGDWLGGVEDAARAFRPLCAAHPVGRGAGELPAELTLLRIADPAVAGTSVRARAEGLCVRVYERRGGDADVLAEAVGPPTRSLAALDGRRLATLGPHEIATLTFAPERPAAEALGGAGGHPHPPAR